MKFIIVVIAAIAIYCYRLPFFHVVDPVRFSVSLPAKLDGPLTPNTRLNTHEKLHEGAIQGPEAFALHNGKIYTGLNGGRVIQITGKEVRDVVRTGKKCAGPHEEHICGRPAGMTFSKTGTLYVVDIHYGLFEVDIQTGKKNLILPSETLVEGKLATFMNNVALDEKEQVLYITQSSTKWNMSEVIYGFIEHEASGRVLKYDLKSKQASVVLKDLPFPNGIELNQDGTAFLVALSTEQKIVKYFIHGQKKGSNVVLPLTLPGEPDNISRTKRGTFWLALLGGRSQENLYFLDKLGDHPLIRKILIFSHKIISTSLSAIANLLPYDCIKETAHKIKTGLIFFDYLPQHSIVIEFDENGKILQSLQSPDGKIPAVTEALEHNGFLYLGSYKNSYIGRVKL